MTPRVLLTHPGAALYGSDRMALATVEGLCRAGARTHVVLGEDGPAVAAARSSGAHVDVVAMPVLRKSALRPAGALRLLGDSVVGAVRAVRTLRRERPDVVYVSTVTTPVWILTARALGLPVVVHVHEAESSSAAVIRALVTAPLLASTALAVNSRFALDVLTRSWPVLARRSTVVLNGIDGPPTPPTPSPTNPPHRILYVGRLSERKGVLVAVEALERLLDRGLEVHLDLVGDVYDEHTEFGDRLAERTRDLARAGHLTFHGFDPDVWRHLAACDVLVVPSVLPEPFGNTAVEGVLAGRPVVASDAGGLPEALAGYDSALLVPAGDAAALADGVVTVLDELPRRLGLAAQDARVAALRHAPATYGDGVLAVLEAAAGSRWGRRFREYST